MSNVVHLNFIFLYLLLAKSIHIPSPILHKPWLDAQLYCQLHCNSNLISIHNNTEMNELQTYLTELDIKLIWIGLNDTTTNGNYEWIDGSPFTFGNITNTYPWIEGHIPSDEHTLHCVHMDRANNYRWNEEECEAEMAFACNSCIEPNYYISPNKFTWKNAESYCIKQCQSNLGSIHYGVDQEVSELLAADTYHSFTVDTIRGTNDVWIGLYFNGTTWNYTDGTVFDYGTDISGSSSQFDDYNPWTPGELLSNGWNNIDWLRIRMDKYATIGYKWIGNGIDFNNEQNRFMCNNCDSILNKYIAINDAKTYDSAKLYCESEIGTTLASIHSDNDMNEATMLCSHINNSQHCWIGLRNNISFGNMQWSDGTSLDYIMNTVNIGCVTLYFNNEYKWNDVDCNEVHNFICNMPSETCNHGYITYNWYNVSGEMEQNKCEMNINNGSIINRYKQWRNMNGLLVIEMIFKMNIIDNNLDSNGGIVLYYNDNNICDYYYISITKDWFIFIDRVINGVIVRIEKEKILFQYDETMFYTLRMEWLRKHIFNISINGNKIISYYDETNTIINKHIKMSGYIGLKTINMNMQILSLFVSGTPIDKYTDFTIDIKNHILQCPQVSDTSHPTFDPTVSPTKTTYNPTMNPSISDITVIPTISPSLELIVFRIEIIVSIEITINTTVTEIEIVLRNITDTLLSQELLCNDYNIFINMKINKNIVITKVNTSVLYDCDNYTKFDIEDVKLLIKDELNKHFDDINILNITINEIIDIFPSLLSTTEITDEYIDDDESTLWIFGVVIGLIVYILCIIIGVLCYFKRCGTFRNIYKHTSTPTIPSETRNNTEITDTTYKTDESYYSNNDDEKKEILSKKMKTTSTHSSDMNIRLPAISIHATRLSQGYTDSGNFNGVIVNNKQHKNAKIVNAGAKSTVSYYDEVSNSSASVEEMYNNDNNNINQQPPNLLELNSDGFASRLTNQTSTSETPQYPPQYKHSLSEQKEHQIEGISINNNRFQMQPQISVEGQDLLPIGEFEIQNSKSVGITKGGERIIKKYKTVPNKILHENKESDENNENNDNNIRYKHKASLDL